MNKKGFTLIELLAVIVILAIILVVTVPNIISSINNARISSIHNLAVSTANTYNTMAAQDAIITTSSEKKLGDIPGKVNGTWQCFDDLVTTTGGTTLTSLLGLSENDLITKGDIPGDATNKEISGVADVNGKCSAIRVKNGKTEIVLVAKPDGKFGLSGKVVYALNTESAGHAETIPTE